MTDNVRASRPLHQQAVAPGGGGHPGVVFVAGMRRNPAAVGHVIAALETELRRHPGDLTDRET